jgi:hypothetical protein
MSRGPGATLLLLVDRELQHLPGRSPLGPGAFNLALQQLGLGASYASLLRTPRRWLSAFPSYYIRSHQMQADGSTNRTSRNGQVETVTVLPAARAAADNGLDGP